MPQPFTPSAIARTLGRRALLRGALATSVAGGAFYALGCGSSSDDSSGASPGETASPGATAGQGAASRPALLTSEFVSGQPNRFAVGLLDGENRLLKDAAVHLRFFTVGADGSTGTFRGETDMAFVELSVADAHTHDGTMGDATDDSAAFYVATAPFDVAGKWGVEVGVKPKAGAPSTVQVPISVLAQSVTPALGALPPASRNDTSATNPDSASLCSRDPACPLHDKVIGDLLGNGRPLVVQFSTPAFCQTRFCGPVLEVLLSKVPQYKDRIDFVHIEVWQDFQLQKARPAMLEWKLQTEPWTFFMSRDGKVAGKLESIFSAEELESALSQLAAL